MKIGKEAEGMHKGLNTLFMDVSELCTWQENFKISGMEGTEIQQVYISDLENTLDLSKVPLELLGYVSNYIFFRMTVERTQIPNKIHPKLDIMLHIENESFWNLRFGDQIKFSKNQFVYAIPRKDMIKTFPEDFEKDITL
jgi:hypothetical protein